MSYPKPFLSQELQKDHTVGEQKDMRTFVSSNVKWHAWE